MKLTLESYRKKYSVETEGDDLDINEYIDIMTGLLIQAGFHRDTIKEVIVELAQEFNEEVS
jgi:hypothetical protein